jgi:mRNA interferase RelE/StbE
MYVVNIERRAVKEIESLPNHCVQLIWNDIKQLRENPRPHGVKKLIGQDGWRVRVNDYRILYTINDKQRLVIIYRVKHRKESYR